MALTGIGVIAVFVIVGLVTGLVGLLTPLGVALGLMAAMLLFGRYAQSAQYKAVEGQPGAAAAIMQSMRGGWTITPAVSANRSMDVVHRAVGRPGVVLVGEGSPNRLAGLLAAEKKRVSRVAFDVPIYDLQVGDEEGQIPIRKLQRKLMRLPRNLKGPAVADLNFRLKALPMEQEMVGTELGQQTDVTGQQRLQFLLRQGRGGRPQCLFRHVGQSPPQFRLVHHPVADLVDRVAAHPGPLRPPASQQPNA